MTAAARTCANLPLSLLLLLLRVQVAGSWRTLPREQALLQRSAAGHPRENEISAVTGRPTAAATPPAAMRGLKQVTRAVAQSRSDGTRFTPHGTDTCPRASGIRALRGTQGASPRCVPDGRVRHIRCAAEGILVARLKPRGRVHHSSEGRMRSGRESAQTKVQGNRV